MYSKRVSMGFQGVRGKKFDEPSRGYIDPSFNEIIHVDDKRGPSSSGFHGMRGKKLYQEEMPLYTNFYHYKRIPAGFHGMRGKKDAETVNYDGLAQTNLAQSYPPLWLDDSKLLALQNYLQMYKRAPQMGFQGVRGKKDVSELIKRAPAEGFFGMRGKKLPSGSQGFFGMRGKKYPYEFRGKFVGVRGKKLLTPSTIKLAEKGNAVDDEMMDENDLKRLQQDSGVDPNESAERVTNLNHLMHLLNDNIGQQSAGSSNDNMMEKRRVQDGFFGMRGKKDTTNEN